MSDARNATEAGQLGPLVPWSAAVICLILAYFALSCGKQAEQPPAPQKANGDATATISVIEAPKQRSLVGQVFVTLENRDTIKLSLTEVQFVEPERAARFAEQLRSKQDSKLASLEIERREIAGRLAEAVTRLDLAIAKAQAASHRLGEANAKVKRLQREYERAPGNADDLRKQLELVTSAQELASDATSLMSKVDRLSEERDGLRKDLKAVEGSIIENSNPAMFFEPAILETAARVTTDADGRFSVRVNIGKPLAVAANADRKANGKTERYAWLFSVGEFDDALMLNNKNMLTRERLLAIVREGTATRAEDSKWISLFNGKDLTGWKVHGKATWSVQDGVLVGVGGMGHIYTDVTCSDFEAKGMFRITEQGAKANSGFYFRANPPADKPDDFPKGYEAQICNDPKSAYTGWLWKPGKPVGKTDELLTKDGEWFSLRIRAVGEHIQFWINDKSVMKFDDAEFKSGHFAIQGHNPGMKIEAKELFYLELNK